MMAIFVLTVKMLGWTLISLAILCLIEALIRLITGESE